MTCKSNVFFKVYIVNIKIKSGSLFLHKYPYLYKNHKQTNDSGNIHNLAWI